MASTPALPPPRSVFPDAQPQGLGPTPTVAGRLLGARARLAVSSQTWGSHALQVPGPHLGLAALMGQSVCIEDLVAFSKKRLNQVSSIWPWGRQARAGRPRVGHSPPANPWGPPRWPGAGLLSISSKPLRELRARTHVPMQSPGRTCGDPPVLRRSPWRKCRLPGPGLGYRGLVSSPTCVLHQPGRALSGGPAILCCRCPSAPSVSRGGPLLQRPQPPPPGARSPRQLPAPWGPPCWGWGCSGSLGSSLLPLSLHSRGGPPSSACCLLNWEGWCVCPCFSCLSTGLGPHSLGSGAPCVGLCALIPACLQEP